jgi:hypothetical protein
MSTNRIKNNDTEATKKVVFKYLNISILNDGIEGSIKVVGFRKYNTHFYRNGGATTEIDIEFTGKYKARNGRNDIWVDSKIYKSPGYSKIKMNRILRKKIFQTLKDRAKLFSIDLDYYSCIKKIKWV